MVIGKVTVQSIIDHINKIDENFTPDVYGTTYDDLRELEIDRKQFIQRIKNDVFHLDNKAKELPVEKPMFTKWKNQFGTKNMGNISLTQFVREVEKENSTITRARKVGKGNDEYKKLKNRTPAYTIAGCWEGHSTKKIYNKSLSGYVYIDIDKKDMGDKTKQEIEKLLHKVPFIGEVWDSFSTNGLGAIAYTTGLMSELNYTSTYKKIANILKKYGINIDTQACNHNRLNVQSNSVVRISDKQIIPIETDINSIIKLLNSKDRSYVVQSKRDISDYDDKEIYNAMFNYLKNTQNITGEISDGNRNKPLYSFVRYFCLSNGIEVDVVKDFGQKYFEGDQKSYQELERQLEYNYDRFPEEFGSAINNKFLEKTLYLADGQYISDLDFTLSDKTSVIAPTGAGKTTFVSKLKDKKIICFPTQSVLEQTADDYKNYKLYYQHVKNTILKGDNVLTTYSSLPSLIKSHNFDLHKYVLVIDEEHNFAASSSRGFRLKDMNNISNLLHYFKKVIKLTATPFPTLCPKHKDFDTLRFVRETPRQFNTTIKIFTKYKDNFEFISNNIVEGKKNIVFLNSSKWEKELGMLSNYLNDDGYKVCCINSKVKEGVNYEYLLKKQLLPDNYDIYIVTSLINEATNIKNKNIGNMFILPTANGKYAHPISMAQFVGRTRSVLPDNVFVCVKDREKEQITDEIFDVQKEQSGIEFFSKNICKAINTINMIDEDINTDSKYLKKFKVNFYRQFSNMILPIKEDDKGIFSVDYNNLANITYNQQAQHCGVNNIENLKLELTKYNFIVNEISMMEESIENEKHVKDMNDIDKDSLNRLTDEIIENITDNESVEVFSKRKESCVYGLTSDIELPEFTKKHLEKDIRSRVLEYMEYVSYDDALKLVRNNGMSTQKHARVKFQINLKVKDLLKSKGERFVITDKNNWVDSVRNIFSNDKDFMFTSNTLAYELNRLYSTHNVFGKVQKFTQKSSLDFLKKFCNIERCQKIQEGDKRVHQYKIVDREPLKCEVRIPNNIQLELSNMNSEPNFKLKRMVNNHIKETMVV